MLLSGIAGNFDADDSNDVCILDLLSLLDEYLERAGRSEATWPRFCVEQIEAGVTLK